MHANLAPALLNAPFGKEKTLARKETIVMALIRWTPQTNLWDPFSNLADIQEEMNRLFDTA